MKSEDSKTDGTITRRSMLMGSAKLTAGAIALGAAVGNVAPEVAVATIAASESVPMTEEIDRYFTTF
jgi:nitrous oxide reductase